MRRHRRKAWSGLWFWAVLSFAAFPFALYAQSPSGLQGGKFSAAPEGAALPDGWKPLTFKKIERHTVYTVVKVGETTAIKAVSEASASGLTKEIKINLKEYPIVQWQWKVANILKKGDVTRKEGDDYPARIFITFEYDSSKVGFFDKAKYELIKLLYGRYPPLAAMNYIWESKAPKGTVVPNPYPERVKMIVVGSGVERVDQGGWDEGY